MGTWLAARATGRRNERADWLGYQERSLRAAVDRADEAERRMRDEERRHDETRMQLIAAKRQSAGYVETIISLREAIHRLESRLNMQQTTFPDIPPGGD